MSRIDKAIEKASRLREVSSSSFSCAAEGRLKEMDRLLDVDPIPVKNPYLVIARNGNDPVSEEYKKLRSLVVSLTKGKEFRNTLLVTSTVGEEGKTITSLNLAIALAQEYDHTVLLVDTDLRRPSIHTYLGIKPDIGLVQCLKDGAPIDKALIKTGIGKLVVLPAGGTVSDPVELLSSNRMKEIIHELKSRYPERYVIFDTPPALPFADARVLGPAVDGVIFVVREGCAKVQYVSEALESLKEANLLGVVYNDVSVQPKKGGYYY
jgi:exopolysaccharide/PEP-CTERM locus tyrosine autokinase